MQQPLEQSADLKGGVSASSTTSRPVFLFADSNRLYLRGFLQRYIFAPYQVVSVEQERDNSISIKHTRPDYPASIIFYSSLSATEILTTIRNKGFIPSASVSDVPIRLGIPVRVMILIPICLVIVWSLLTGNSFGLNQLVHSQKLGNWRPIPIGVIFSISAIIRFFPPAQWLILQPGRQIGEISPMLNVLILVSGLGGIVSVSIISGIPELFAILIAISIFWLIIQLDRRFTE
jgi:hypothetical protein